MKWIISGGSIYKVSLVTSVLASLFIVSCSVFSQSLPPEVEKNIIRSSVDLERDYLAARVIDLYENWDDEFFSILSDPYKYLEIEKQSTELNVRGRGKVLPAEEAGGVEQVLCFTTLTRFSNINTDNSSFPNLIIPGIALRVGDFWDFNWVDIETWQKNSCPGDYISGFQE